MTAQPATSPPDTGVPEDAGVRRATVNGIELAYETFGERDHPPILLVMGLGTQMLAWPDEFCQQLADAGNHVIRFDNRDVGLSTHHHDDPPPRLRDLLLRRREPPYRLDDLSDDAFGLLDELGIDHAHVVGASMGGFIAQTMALRHPGRVRSLTLVMTSTGSRRVGRPRTKVLALVALRLLGRRGVPERDEAIAAAVAGSRLIGSPGYPFDEEARRDLATRAYDRGYDPAGQLRQLWAINVQPNRTRDLAAIHVPALVVHGLEDPLVRVDGGLAVARAIPAATFVGYPGMGHDLPRELWPDIVVQILALTATADEQAQAAGRDSPGTTRANRELPTRWRRALRRRR